MKNKVAWLGLLLVAGHGLAQPVVLNTSRPAGQEGRQSAAGEFHIALSKPSQPGKLVLHELEVDVIIERHGGKDVVVTQDGRRALPEKARGLRSLTSAGEDNTGLGLEVKESNNTVEIAEAAKQDGTCHVMVPDNMNIQVLYRSPHSGSLTLRNIAGEIEINGGYADIKLEDVTGPAVINTTGGEVEARFTKVSQKSPISISSTGGDVDVTLPGDTPANVRLNTMGGEIYSDMKLEMEKKDGLERFGGREAVNGKLNGGGVQIDLRSMGGSIYLRTRK
ncbi:MAG TPA: DUF4097 family beta strand repeat-containing protein [Cytophagales bacterium]